MNHKFSKMGIFFLVTSPLFVFAQEAKPAAKTDAPAPAPAPAAASAPVSTPASTSAASEGTKVAQATPVAENGAAETPKAAPVEEKPKIPEIPATSLKTSEALRIRQELEWLRKDVEQKIIRLESAKVAYDKSKENVGIQLKKVEEERRLLDETLLKEKNIKEERLKETVDFVAKMDPRAVSPILEGMDRDLVMALFTKLPQRQVTKILENMAPPKATQFLEYFTHIRSGREFEMLKDMGLCSASKENDAKIQSGQDAAKPK